MRIQVTDLRRIIRNQMLEALGAFKMLDTVDARLILKKGMKIEEIITGIRIVKGVATVNQASAVERTPGGKRILDVLISFDPEGMDTLQYLDAMARIAKKIKSVKTVVIRTLNGRPVRDATGKRKLVY